MRAKLSNIKEETVFAEHSHSDFAQDPAQTIARISTQRDLTDYFNLRAPINENGFRQPDPADILQIPPLNHWPGRVTIGESYDSYPRVALNLNPRWRIIVCRDAIQWIVQYRKSVAPNRWRGHKYFRWKDSLIIYLDRFEKDEPSLTIKNAANNGP